MSVNIWDRYGTYPKKKGKKRIRIKEGQFLKRSYEWLKWEIANSGDISFRHPSLEH